MPARPVRRVAPELVQPVRSVHERGERARRGVDRDDGPRPGAFGVGAPEEHERRPRDLGPARRVHAVDPRAVVPHLVPHETERPADAGRDREVRDDGSFLRNEREERRSEVRGKSKELALAAPGQVDDPPRRSGGEPGVGPSGAERPADGEERDDDQGARGDTSSRTPKMDRHASPRSSASCGTRAEACRRRGVTSAHEEPLYFS